MTIKILIVDDSQDTTWLLKRVLTEEGYAVQLAHDGREGLRQAFDYRPDLVLLDVMMPDMDGWTMLSRLREFSGSGDHADRPRRRTEHGAGSR
jgi:DNA-binding response OmpR family regulator